ncbi:MAG: RHO alpha subunit C-terminal catalytic domain-containing protein, partial [Pseudomonadota bacterium]
PSVWDTTAEYIGLYPNVLLGIHRDHAYAILLSPEGHETTRERVEIFYATQEAATAPAFEPLRQKNAALWKAVFEEDIFVVEGMQKGRRAPHFDGGRFSPAMDGPTHCFHAWVAERISSGIALGD